MINEIKTIVKNYLNNEALCCLLAGTVTSNGIKVSGKLTIPYDLVIGNLRSSITTGQTVRLLRDHGGQRYFILEVIDG